MPRRLSDDGALQSEKARFHPDPSTPDPATCVRRQDLAVGRLHDFGGATHTQQPCSADLTSNSPDSTERPHASHRTSATKTFPQTVCANSTRGTSAGLYVLPHRLSTRITWPRSLPFWRVGSRHHRCQRSSPRVRPSAVDENDGRLVGSGHASSLGWGRRAGPMPNVHSVRCYPDTPVAVRPDSVESWLNELTTVSSIPTRRAIPTERGPSHPDRRRHVRTGRRRGHADRNVGVSGVPDQGVATALIERVLDTIRASLSRVAEAETSSRAREAPALTRCTADH